MIMVDNGLGVGVGMAAKKFSPEDYSDMEGQIIGTKIYGESPALDCP